MTRRAVLGFALIAVLISSAPAMSAKSRLSRKLQRIELACKLATGTLTAVGGEVHFTPSPNEKYKNVDCALAKLKRGRVEKMGFIGNEADPSAVLQAPYRYIAEGTATTIADLAAAARANGWIIVKSAKADDETSFLILETHPGETFGGADQLMQRIWRKEFGEMLLGRAPEPLVEPNSNAAQ